MLIAVKQHGGNTGTGAALAEIVGEVNDDGVKISYDAGNVMDYHKINPLPDLAKCAGGCAASASRTIGCFRRMRIAVPAWARSTTTGCWRRWRSRAAPCRSAARTSSLRRCPGPATPEDIDSLARRAREFLEIVIAGVQA